ncbi:outer membrane receptor protein involved in Fe transport [Sphingobium sp. B2D3C]|nr:outer membrane receptor protein involved in Fe transport [Sphingobium sp. B2D3C]
MDSFCVRAALACTTALTVLSMPSGAIAQQTDGADEQSIVVTGSRIVRRDYEASSPIVTAGQELLQNSSTAALETNLNKLPAFTPVQTPAIASDIQPTATSTPGAATVSLRNLGTNRNLVLVDGRRATPANALGVVDINTIPAAAIERVEIITGGASATYGADAVGGVVNFILKKNFQGLQFDTQMGISQRGDGREFSISGIMGANFDDGRGNITIGLSMNDRESALRRDRPWFRNAWKDPRFTGTEFFPDFSGYQPIGGNNPNQALLNSWFGTTVNTQGQTVPNVAAGSRLYFNDDGTAFTGFFQSPTGGASRFKGDLTGLKWKRQGDGSLGQNFQDELLVLPLNRYNLYARGNYEINDWIGAFAQGTFTRVQTHTVQQPSPSVNGWSALIPVDGRAIPTELAQVLASRGNPTAPWQLTYYLNYANREARTDVFTYNLVAGLEGKVPGTDWTWEAYASQGESETNALITGTASLARFRAVIQSPNWGAGFKSQGNAAFGGFGAASATCTSGFNPFDPNAQVSQDCIDAIRADLKNRAVMQQSVFEANAQGGLFNLPAGQVRAAVGASHRQNRYEFQNDTLTSQGTSFQDQAIGIYPSGNSQGLIRVDEFYGELLVPVLSDLPLIRKLDVTVGARNSHYNTTGNAFTWKAMADWEVTDFLTIRGGFNKAVRAPNVAELFLAPQQTFTAAGGGDVCRLNNGLAWSANTAKNSNAANVQAVCRILMDQTIAGTANTFYSDPAFYNAQGPAFAFPTLVGNPSVQPEKAKTWTLGAVLRSTATSELLRRLRLTVDYYNIKVDDAIGPLTLDTAQRQCFDPVFNPAIANNPTAAAATAACQAIGRVAGDGALGNVQVTYLNNGRFRTSGIDVQLDWSVPVGPGTFSINSVFNYLLSLKSAPLPASAGAAGQLVEYAGTLGPAGSAAIAENGLNPGSFRWKMLNSFSYAVGPVTVGLQWQHLPAAKSITYTSNNATTFVGAPAYDLFNLNGSFAVTRDATLRWGVDNLFDKAPPLLEYNTGAALGNGVGASPFNAYFYDMNGRRFYLGASFKF